MRVSRIKIESFLVKIALTREQEAGCDDCARLSARLAQAMLAENIQEPELIAILYHLQQCIPCAEEFKVLNDCAQMDAEDSWPSFEEMWRALGAGEDAPLP